MADALSRVGRRAGTRSELEAMVHGASRVRDVYRAPSLFGVSDLFRTARLEDEVGGRRISVFCESVLFRHAHALNMYTAEPRPLLTTRAVLATS